MVWAAPRSLATTKGITFVLFSYRYLDVSVPCVCLPYGMICLQHTGLPHSEISASKVICTYAELIAAYHVLHRLWEPRHPPYALIFLLDCYSLFFICLFVHFHVRHIWLISVFCFVYFPTCQRTLSLRTVTDQKESNLFYVPKICFNRSDSKYEHFT